MTEQEAVVGFDIAAYRFEMDRLRMCEQMKEIDSIVDMLLSCHKNTHQPGATERQ